MAENIGNNIIGEGLVIVSHVARKVGRRMKYAEISDLISEGIYQVGINYMVYDVNRGSIKRFWWGILYRRLLLFVVTGESWLNRKKAIEHVDVSILHLFTSVPMLERRMFVQELLDSLSIEDRTILWEKYAEGWTVSELMKNNKKTRNYIEDHLQRSKSCIRNLMRTKRHFNG